MNGLAFLALQYCGNVLARKSVNEIMPIAKALVKTASIENLKSLAADYGDSAKKILLPWIGLTTDLNRAFDDAGTLK